MRKDFSFTELSKHQFTRYDISQEWIDAIGKIEHGFNCIIWGESGSGKTTLALRILGVLTEFGNVYYNALEQGFSGSLQDNITAAGLTSKQTDRIKGHVHSSYEEMLGYVKKTRARFIAIDSVQYMGNIGLTYSQYKELKQVCKRGKKSLILISHAEKDKPKGNHAKSIRYDVDIKIFCREGKTYVDSRYGKTKPYTIYSKKKDTTSLF